MVWAASPYFTIEYKPLACDQGRVAPNSDFLIQELPRNPINTSGGGGVVLLLSCPVATILPESKMKYESDSDREARIAQEEQQGEMDTLRDNMHDEDIERGVRWPQTR